MSSASLTATSATSRSPSSGLARPRSPTSARAIFEELTTRDPRDQRARGELAVLCSNLAQLRLLEGRDSAALELARRGLALARERARLSPSSQKALGTLANCYQVLASVFESSQRKAEALGHLRQARDLFVHLVEADDGSNVAFRLELANIQGKLGDFLRSQHQHQEALASYRKAREIFSQVLERRPEHPRARLGNAMASLKIGTTLMKQAASAAAAVTALGQAREELEPLCAIAALSDQARLALASAHNGLGASYRKLARPEQASLCFRKSCALLETLLEEQGENPQLRSFLTSVRQSLAALGGS